MNATSILSCLLLPGLLVTNKATNESLSTPTIAGLHNKPRSSGELPLRPFVPPEKKKKNICSTQSNHIFTMDPDQPQNLRSLFVTAKADKTALEVRPDTTSELYRRDVTAVIAKFEECQRLVRLLSLFSANEPIEEVSTGDLQ